MRRLILLALLAAVPGAFAGTKPIPIVIGGTAPLSGPESAYSVVAAGAAAYFKYVNANGGVFGRPIDYRYYDDAYDPAQTIQQTRRLVEQDRAFAIFNTIGTEHALAIRPYLNQLDIPELFVGSGASAFGRDAAKYPWTLPYLPSFAAEGRIYGAYSAQTQPGARIAVLYEDDDFGHDLLSGLETGLGGKGTVVAKATYSTTEADVTSQIAKLKASKADTLMLFALPKQVIQAFVSADKLGWRPRIFVTSVSIDPFVMSVARFNTGNRTTEGALSIAFLKDASNLRRWGSDPGVRLYYRIMKTYAPGSDPKAVANFYGMSVAFTLVDALKHAGPNPTRKGLLDAATHLNETDNPFLLPGISIRTGPGDRYPLDQVQLYRYSGGVWHAFGPVIQARP